MNVNQQQFGIATATSLAQLTGRRYQLPAVAAPCWNAWSGVTYSCGPVSWAACGRSYLACFTATRKRTPLKWRDSS
jgi:hypothetical protein